MAYNFQRPEQAVPRFLPPHQDNVEDLKQTMLSAEFASVEQYNGPRAGAFATVSSSNLSLESLKRVAVQDEPALQLRHGFTNNSKFESIRLTYIIDSPKDAVAGVRAAISVQFGEVCADRTTIKAFTDYKGPAPQKLTTTIDITPAEQDKAKVLPWLLLQTHVKGGILTCFETYIQPAYGAALLAMEHSAPMAVIRSADRPKGPQEALKVPAALPHILLADAADSRLHGLPVADQAQVILAHAARETSNLQHAIVMDIVHTQAPSSNTAAGVYSLTMGTAEAARQLPLVEAVEVTCSTGTMRLVFNPVNAHLSSYGVTVPCPNGNTATMLQFVQACCIAARKAAEISGSVQPQAALLIDDEYNTWSPSELTEDAVLACISTTDGVPLKMLRAQDRGRLHFMVINFAGPAGQAALTAAQHLPDAWQVAGMLAPTSINTAAISLVGCSREVSERTTPPMQRDTHTGGRGAPLTAGRGGSHHGPRGGGTQSGRPQQRPAPPVVDRSVLPVLVALALDQQPPLKLAMAAEKYACMQGWAQSAVPTLKNVLSSQINLRKPMAAASPGQIFRSMLTSAPTQEQQGNLAAASAAAAATATDASGNVMALAPSPTSAPAPKRLCHHGNIPLLDRVKQQQQRFHAAREQLLAAAPSERSGGDHPGPQTSMAGPTHTAAGTSAAANTPPAPAAAAATAGDDPHVMLPEASTGLTTLLAGMGQAAMEPNDDTEMADSLSSQVSLSNSLNGRSYLHKWICECDIHQWLGDQPYTYPTHCYPNYLRYAPRPMLHSPDTIISNARKLSYCHSASPGSVLGDNLSSDIYHMFFTIKSAPPTVKKDNCTCITNMAMVFFPCCTGLTQAPTTDWSGVRSVTQALARDMEPAMLLICSQRHQVVTPTCTRADARCKSGSRLKSWSPTRLPGRDTCNRSAACWWCDSRCCFMRVCSLSPCVSWSHSCSPLHNCAAQRCLLSAVCWCQSNSVITELTMTADITATSAHGQAKPHNMHNTSITHPFELRDKVICYLKYVAQKRVNCMHAQESYPARQHTTLPHHHEQPSACPECVHYWTCMYTALNHESFAEPRQLHPVLASWAQ